jgi:enoyl-CoA hydratase/carnithine racemase
VLAAVLVRLPCSTLHELTEFKLRRAERLQASAFLQESVMDYSQYKCLSVSIEDRVATVTMRRPDNLNTASVGLVGELETFWLNVATDENVAAIVLTGGGKAFSAGGDIKHMAARAGTVEGLRHSLRTPQATRRLWQHMLEVEQPIIAAINGDAMGFGANLALFCDVTFMSEEARIGDTHVKVGLVAGDGGAVIWPLLIGVGRAKEFLMRGKVINGTEAHSIGLVNHAVAADRLQAAAREVALELAALPKWAVRWTKLSVNKHLQASLNLVFDTSISYEMLTMQTADFAEAAKSFVEKRRPTFIGD